MSSEVPEGSAPPPGSRRTSRSGDGGAPVSGALTIVLAIVAVVAGFLILRSISDDDDNDSATPETEDTTGDTSTDATATTVTTLPLETTTTTIPLTTQGATVVVANVSNQNGAAGQMSRALAAVGYTLGEATNGAASVGQLEETVIYFDPAQPAAQAVAESVGRSLGGVASISPVATPPPVESGDLGGAGVLVMLGVDKAGRTLEELNPASTATSAAPTGATAPPVAGSTESTTAP
jgi:hypothetical protein